MWVRLSTLICRARDQVSVCLHSDLGPCVQRAGLLNGTHFYTKIIILRCEPLPPDPFVQAKGSASVQ